MDTEIKPKYPALMLDIETLGTKPGCVVFAIGAVAFDPTQRNTQTLGFYCIINVAESIVSYGLGTDPDTVAWWDVQSDAARRELENARNDLAHTVVSALTALTTFTKTHCTEDFTVWGNGAAFDVPILAEVFRRTEMPTPWNFRGSRCFRTLKALIPITYVPPDVPHHALSDAVAQAAHVCKLFEFARVRGVNLKL